MKPGKKTKPHKLKVLEGVNNKDRLNYDEPIPCDKDLRRPTWVNGYAREVWERLEPELVEMKVLTFVDRDIFGAYCVAVKDFRDAEKDGDVRLTLQVGREMRILASELGMSPSGRAGLRVPKSPKGGKKDTKTKLFGDRSGA